MEDLAGYANDVWAAVQQNVRDAVAFASDFSNVEADVVADVKRNNDLRDRIGQTRETIAATKTQGAAQVAQARDKVEARRTANAEEAAPILTAIDDVVMAKHYYTRVMDAFGEQHRGMEALMERETNGYGYNGKRLLSSMLVFGALKDRINAGEPFSEELAAFREEVGGSEGFELMSMPLGPAAQQGLPTHAWLSMAARDVAASLAEASATQGTSLGGRSWLDRLKLSVPEQRSTAVKVEKPSDDASFLTLVANREYGAAVALMDTAIEKGQVADVHAGSRVMEVADAFRHRALDVTAAQQFVDYCEASFVTTQLHFVESVLAQ